MFQPAVQYTGILFEGVNGLVISFAWVGSVVGVKVIFSG